mmetsp:Transcript_54283/g.87888  ORF Transcript_54283/g.87888 Transcript_54283/m.87888 type:complete len:164 (-) Transcript_54283:338-829(-)|eukprot:CAMPEP_0179444910 /NCGR_PEP_ID=MMETSP0799-20121207/28327_1 /TAXON_ID=46947 /ORGANISM="Geminigera cryophila, Strain CCMP2564" /LENGTH=163 /DNA_ID=CAMNT_0021232367 /DNA_START=288 /DNA_END=779 /DNA_ORIENTATION=+
MCTGRQRLDEQPGTTKNRNKPLPLSRRPSVLSNSSAASSAGSISSIPFFKMVIKERCGSASSPTQSKGATDTSAKTDKIKDRRARFADECIFETINLDSVLAERVNAAYSVDTKIFMDKMFLKPGHVGKPRQICPKTGNDWTAQWESHRDVWKNKVVHRNVDK